MPGLLCRHQCRRHCGCRALLSTYAHRCLHSLSLCAARLAEVKKLGTMLEMLEDEARARQVWQRARVHAAICGAACRPRPCTATLRAQLCGSMACARPPFSPGCMPLGHASCPPSARQKPKMEILLAKSAEVG